MTSRREQPGSPASDRGIRIGSEQERQEAEAALRDYEQRKTKVRRVLEEVLVTECERTDGLLFEILSEGYRERTGKRPESGMVADFLAGLPDRLFPSQQKPKRTPTKRKAKGPRPVAVVGAGDGEQPVTGGWAGAFRYVASAVVKDNPGRADIWESLQFVQSQLPDYAPAKVEVAPGLWLNTHGAADDIRSRIRVMLDAFQYPANRWRVRLDNGNWQTL